MPELESIASPLGAECDPEDTLSDVLEVLRLQDPVPLVVVRGDDVLGTIGLETVVSWFAVLDQTNVRDVMRPAPEIDLGERIDRGADVMRQSAAEAAIVTGLDGGIFSRSSAPVGMVSAAHILGAIAKNVIDKAPMKIMSGHLDLGFNVPITPCQRNCPIRQDIATYIDYVSQGRYVDAWRVSHETNPFPSMLGRLCNHPCETDCKRGWVQGPENAVSIKSLKRFATDYAWARRVKVDWQRASENGKRVAVVGSGPAGMTAAQDLRLMGYGVDLYEREAKLGGLLSASIPHFRFDHDQLLWEIQMIVDMGVNVHLSANVGKDIKVEQLLNDYDAVFLSVGMMTGRILPVPGSDLTELISAMEFLRVRSYDIVPDNFPRGGDVVVIGGGAVATDAAQTSIKSGARKGGGGGREAARGRAAV